MFLLREIKSHQTFSKVFPTCKFTSNKLLEQMEILPLIAFLMWVYLVFFSLLYRRYEGNEKTQRIWLHFLKINIEAKVPQSKC